MSWLGGVGQRLRELLSPSRLDADLDAELQQHFDHELSRLLASGVPEQEARRRAQLRLGRLDLAREVVAGERTGRVLSDAAGDVRYAVRALRRNPGFTGAVVISLALGVGGTTAIFSVVHAVLLRPLPYPQSHQLHLVRVWWNDFSASLSVADYVALQEQSHGVAEIGASFLPDGGFAMEGAEGPEVVKGMFVTAELPAVLRVSPVVGRGFFGDAAECQTLIGHDLWQRRFSSRPDAVGDHLVLDGESCAVVGVMPAGFHVPGQRDDEIWVRGRLKAPTRRGGFFLDTIARVPDAVNPDAAAARLTALVTPVLRDRYGVTNQWRYGLRAEQDVLTGNVRETLLLTLCSVSLVLLIAIANVANLMLARGTVRAREMAVRASLGAGRARLARQLLTESALLGVLGGGLGLLLAGIGVDLARGAAALVVPRMDEVRLDPTVVAFAVLTGLAAGLVAGVMPVVRLPWARLGTWLREGGRAAGEGIRDGRLRRGLVVAEVALTLTVLTGSALLVKSLLRLQSADPGFQPAGVLSFLISLPPEPYKDPDRTGIFVTDLDSRLRALPGVTAVAESSSLPPDLLTFSNNYSVEGATTDTAGTGGVAEWNMVSPDYFRALGIALVGGRVFEQSDRAGSPSVALVNEAFVRRHYPDGRALGKRLKGGDWDPRGPWTTIVGVVRDVPYERGVWGGAHPMVYTALAQNFWYGSPYVVIKSGGDPSALVPAIRSVVARLDSRVPLRDVATMSDVLRRSTTVPRFRGALFSILGGLALALAATGTYGVMAYHVSRRRRETAIRRALGASVGQVVGMVLGSGMRLAFAGVVLGAIGALLGTRSLSSLLFHVEPRDPSVFLASAALVSLSALVACTLPALRAGKTDPAAILRDE
jgi:putative ABC transport system permease protein